MLYHFLLPLADDIGIFNLIRYITFRTASAAILAFLIGVIFGGPLIRALGNRGWGQVVRDDGPETHLEKHGTPTMGGLLMIGSVLLSVILLADLTNPYVISAIVIIAGYAFIGFLDDYLKIARGHPGGLPGKLKITGQIVIGTAVLAYLFSSGYETHLTVPFFKDFQPELGWLYYPFGLIILVGASNAVNLTDGLDGLAAGTTAVSFGAYLIIAYLVGRVDFSSYLGVTYVPGAGELAIICGAMVGSCLAFLWFNAPPAEIFMGDVGALSLGGALGLVAIATKQEITLALVGGLFVVEAMSVMLQVGSYKLRGKRIFKMAPIHHHFELKGWAETKVLVRFWIIASLLALAGVASLKVR